LISASIVLMVIEQSDFIKTNNYDSRNLSNTFVDK